MRPQSRLRDSCTAYTSPKGLTCGTVIGRIVGNVSTRTLINNIPAAYVSSTCQFSGPVDPFGAPSCLPFTWQGTIVSGSTSVLIENHPAVGCNDADSWSGIITQGSPDVFIP